MRARLQGPASLGRILLALAGPASPTRPALGLSLARVCVRANVRARTCVRARVCVCDAQGFDPVYTGNWPMGHVLGSMSEGERLLAVPELKDKDICFLANHGTLQISSSIEEALFDCFNVERLCKEQVHKAMGPHPRHRPWDPT